jgi:hypothetical protein
MHPAPVEAGSLLGVRRREQRGENLVRKLHPHFKRRSFARRLLRRPAMSWVQVHFGFALPAGD